MRFCIKEAFIMSKFKIYLIIKAVELRSSSCDPYSRIV